MNLTDQPFIDWCKEIGIDYTSLSNNQKKQLMETWSFAYFNLGYNWEQFKKAVKEFIIEGIRNIK